MATPPDFTAGQVLTAAQMNAVGLWLVKKQTIGTTVSSVTVTDAFSADFDNYRIIVSGQVGSANAITVLTLGASTASYYWGGVVFTLTASGGATSGVNTTSWRLGSTDTAGGVVTADVMRPFAAAPTSFTVLSHNFSTNSANGLFFTATGWHNEATSYTAFTITPASGTLTGGTIYVYGYRN